jgi:Phosphorylase superfamily
MLTILVPQGAEYQAVCRGLKTVSSPPFVFPIPIGYQPLTNYLKTWLETHKPKEIILMGLGGSLKPQYQVGDIVVYQDCIYHEKKLICDPELTAKLQNQLPKTTNLVTGLTSDRVISNYKEKLELGIKYHSDVVDMEGFAALDFFKNKATLAIVRVISDGTDYNIPDLSKAIDENGKIQPLYLAKEMLKDPRGGYRLIQGSLQGLKVLEDLTKSIFYVSH